MPETIIMLRLIFSMIFFFDLPSYPPKQNSGDVHNRLSLLPWKQVSCFLAPGDRLLTRKCLFAVKAFEDI